MDVRQVAQISGNSNHWRRKLVCPLIFAEENSDFIAQVEAKYTAQDFTSRLQEFVDAHHEDESDSAIGSIAAKFGIQPTPQIDENETTSDEQPAETKKSED